VRYVSVDKSARGHYPLRPFDRATKIGFCAHKWSSASQLARAYGLILTGAAGWVCPVSAGCEEL